MLYNQGKKATSKLKLLAGFVGALMMTATSYAANITVTSSTGNDIDGGDTATITLTNLGPGEVDFGANAINVVNVTFGGISAFSINNAASTATSLVVTTPNKALGTGAGPVTVQVSLVGGGPYTVINGFTYQPEVAALPIAYQTIASPQLRHHADSRPVTGEGFGFTITGKGFSTGCTVTVDGVAATGVTVNPGPAPAAGTVITVTGTPAVTSGPGYKTVVVTNPNGTTVTASGLQGVEYLPTITSIDVDGAAAEGPVAGGTLLTVHGTGFVTGATSLTIGAVGSPRTTGAAGTLTDAALTDAAVTDVVIVDDTTLTCVVSTSAYVAGNQAGDKLLAIRSNDKVNYQNTSSGFHSSGTSAGASFKFVPTINPLVVNPDATTASNSGIQPLSGQATGGYQLAINGTGFRNSTGASNVTSVTVGGTPVTVDSNNGTQLIVTVPALAVGRKDVVVSVEDDGTAGITAGDANVTKTNGFSVNNGAPAFGYDQTRNTNALKTGEPAANQDGPIGVGIPMDPFQITATNFPIFYDCTIAPNTQNVTTLSQLGLSLNQTTGKISGTPNRGGYYVLYVTAANTDSNNVVSKVRTEVRLRFGLFNVNSPKIKEAPYANPNPTAVNSAVQFFVTTTDDDNDANTYFWNFGDDSVVTDENRKLNPFHTYTASGTYQVTLSAWDGIGTPLVNSNLRVVVDSSVGGTKMVVQQASVNFDFKKSATKSVFYAKGLMDIPTKSPGFLPGAATVKVLGPSSDAFTPTSDTDTAAALADDTLANDIVAVWRTGVTPLPTGARAVTGFATPAIKKGGTGGVGVKNTEYTYGDTENFLKLKVLTLGLVTGRASFEVTLLDDKTNTPPLNTLFGQMGQSEGGLGYKQQTIKSKNKQQVANRLLINLASQNQAQNPSLNNQYSSFLMDYTCVAYKVGKGGYKQGK